MLVLKLFRDTLYFTRSDVHAHHRYVSIELPYNVFVAITLSLNVNRNVCTVCHTHKLISADKYSFSRLLRLARGRLNLGVDTDNNNNNK